jgi:hypothetical protein
MKTDGIGKMRKVMIFLGKPTSRDPVENLRVDGNLKQTGCEDVD